MAGVLAWRRLGASLAVALVCLVSSVCGDGTYYSPYSTEALEWTTPSNVCLGAATTTTATAATAAATATTTTNKLRDK